MEKRAEKLVNWEEKLADWAEKLSNWEEKLRSGKKNCELGSLYIFVKVIFQSPLLNALKFH